VCLLRVFYGQYIQSRKLTSTRCRPEVLACSRPHVVKLIDEGKLRAEKMPGGTHRRMRLNDLISDGSWLQL